jgi:serine protease Do
MSCFAKCGFAALIALLAWGVAPPLCDAQTEVIEKVIQVNSSGSYLGIQMEDVTATNMSKYKLSSERGIIVREVMKGSPAEAANLKEDDVILEFGGTQVWSTTQLSRLVQETPVGRKVELALSRDGKRMNLSAQIGKRDEGRSENRRGPAPEDFSWNDRREFQFQMPDGNRMFLFRGPDAPGSNSTDVTGRRPRLGVTLQPLTDQMGEFLGVPNKKGVLVAAVNSGSPSAGKLKSGDVIIGADGKDIESPEALTQLIRSKSQGAVTLRVIRDKKEIKVVVDLPADENQKGYKL